jgi:acyl-CoA reductase-like NAD-dependent aldehyde dehydrogenase
VPLSAYRLADIHTRPVRLGRCSAITGDPREIADEMLTNPHVDLVTFTGGVPIGKYIAQKAGYRRVVLELGGNDPIIVMDDADLDEASSLAVQGSYKNSGQRCTAVKRILVHEKVAARFTDLVVERTRPGPGDPADPQQMGPSSTKRPRLFESRSTRAIARRGAAAGLAIGARGAVLAHRDRPSIRP